MTRRVAFDPRRLDVDAFADGGGSLAGRCGVASLARLASLVLPETDAAARWEATGEVRSGADRHSQRWIRLSIQCPVRMTCQRCLEPVMLDLQVERAVRFVATEAEAERLDLESDDDVLATSRHLDLVGLVEDELVLALPPVPRHDRCVPPFAADPDSAEAPPRPNPFAALRKALRDDPD